MQIFFIEEKRTNILKKTFKPMQIKDNKIILYYSCKKDPVPIAKLQKFAKKTRSQLQKNIRCK